MSAITRNGSLFGIYICYSCPIRTIEERDQIPIARRNTYRTMDRIMISWPLTPALSPVIVGIAFLLAAAFPIYRLFFAPLSHIPGPKITALTCLWVIYHEFKGDRTLQLDRLHQQYGPVVRVSPGEVSFNCYEALKEIYGVQSKFSKSSFYDMFVYYNERNTFTSLDKAAVSVKKNKETLSPINI